MPNVVTPSMAEAAKIRDVAARHAYVFDNGLCSPDFFDVAKRMASEEFGMLRERIGLSDSVLEVGCFTGLNLLGLASIGHSGKLAGCDFVDSALNWLRSQPNASNIDAKWWQFDYNHIPRQWGCGSFEQVVCFDVLEHQQNVERFLRGVADVMSHDGRALFLVPIGTNYNDCGHVAWFPDVECLRNVLDYVFEVEEIFELRTCRKMFASCRRRN